MPEVITKKIRIDLPKHPADIAGESFWADLVTENTFRIKNPPFFAYGVNYLDLVLVEGNASGTLEVKKVIERSGHRAVRVFFIDNKSAEENYTRLLEFKGDGVGAERWNDALFSLNVTPESDYERLVKKLEEQQEQGILEFELCGEWEGNFDGTE